MAGRLHVVKDRADKLLVSLGLFDSRASARAAIEAGNVTAGGVVVTKPSQMLSRDDRIEAQPAHPYVSRGGL
ncbi:MAG TPA: TlyA family rRNA (cytidine-2'-O)-methyltransferase, partial [Hyphomonas sp.]|nr:TlyA family rRNA (cytidine-2'-O)-methyltransferase [Hyphomonas sp.]